MTMNMCITIGDESVCPPLFDLLELVDEDPSTLIPQIPPLIESPDECMRNTTTTHHQTALHTFPDPPSLHYMHEEVAYRPEDHSPVFSLEPFCETSPLQPQYQPCSNIQFCPVWPPREMEAQHDHAAPFLADPPSLQESYPTYTQSGNSYPLPALYFSHENPLYTLPASSPQTPTLAPLTPILSPPTPAVDSPFSLSSSSEIGTDTALNSPYPSSTMESEPEMYYDESEFAQKEFLPAHAQYATHAHFYTAQHPAFYADATQHAYGYQQLAGNISPAPVVPDAYSPIPFAQSVSPSQEWPAGPARFTSKNAHDSNYEEQYYAGDSVVEAYSNLASSTDGESNTYSGYQNYPGFTEGAEQTLSTSIDEHDYYIPNTHTMPEHPRADIHQVLEELNALKPSLRSIPERTKRNYAEYHNTLAKLASESESGSGKRAHREDLSKIIGVSHLTTPAKATAMNMLPARAYASTQSHASSTLHRVPAIDSDTMARIINRKPKRSLDIENKSPLDTIIKGSKVLRLTHSYQQAIVKPEPIPKKRKTKKEVIEHIHKQIPEFSSLPQPVPKATPKKPNKDFWKTLF